MFKTLCLDTKNYIYICIYVNIYIYKCICIYKYIYISWGSYLWEALSRKLPSDHQDNADPGAEFLNHPAVLPRLSFPYSSGELISCHSFAQIHPEHVSVFTRANSLVLNLSGKSRTSLRRWWKTWNLNCRNMQSTAYTTDFVTGNGAPEHTQCIKNVTYKGLCLLRFIFDERKRVTSWKKLKKF